MKKDEQIKRQFGQKLRSLRIARDWSQTDLGHQAEVEPQYVSKIELGKANPGLTIIVKLAIALQCNPNDLIDLDGMK